MPGDAEKAERKKARKDAVNRILVGGAKAILAVMILGMLPFLKVVYDDVRDLQAQDEIVEVKSVMVDRRLDTGERRMEKLYDKLDQLHYHLIRSKNVVIPPPAARK